MSLSVLSGRAFPLGATVSPEGVNFCIYSSTCTALELLLFDDVAAAQPQRVIPFDLKLHKSVHYWHMFVPGLQAGQLYGYRAYGPFAPERGLRFDPSKVLLDPYAKAIAAWEQYDRKAAQGPGDNCAQALKSVVVDPDAYDWEDDFPLQVPYARSVIYELHVGGFTRHPNSGVAPEKRGTYAGLMEKIPYLQELGVNAVELMPVHQFDQHDVLPGLENYWGYSTLGFFAPHWQYSADKTPLGPVNEFRDLVKAMHRAGIQVILDVVFNHTAEGNHTGPTLSFKGLDNPTYYILESDPSFYSNYTGCGNTVKANHPIVSRLILDSLRYWVTEMHVDGFRFDLAAILGRSIAGEPLQMAPILWTIDVDPMLVESKVIAEAWDAAGLYVVGQFISKPDRFAEWNGPFRDDIRRFVKGDPGMVGKLAARILGSPDIYYRADLASDRSINFVTCHDGFTLYDLVSYNHKHNLANGENNQDGANDNHSWNCGVEGPTDDPEIAALRQRQIKNFLTILLMSQGTPMLLMGDEVRRSQQGNNNAYAQNNEISWFDWDCVHQHADLHRFVREGVRLHQSLEIFSVDRMLQIGEDSHQPYLVWHGTGLYAPDWDEHSHSLAFTLCHPLAGEQLHVILNAYWKLLRFELPPLAAGQQWRRLIDTSLASPEDCCSLEQAPPVTGKYYPATERSAIVLRAV